MKYLLEFVNFNKNYKKLNEGGGAGKEFSFDDIEYRLLFEFSEDGLKLINKHVSLGDKLDIIGYEDGLRNINVEGLFETDIIHNLTTEKVGSIKISDIVYHVGVGVLFPEYTNDMTLQDVVENGETIKINLSGNGKLEYMYGRGYMLSTISENQILKIDTDDISGDYSNMDYINDIDVVSLFGKYGFNVQLTLKATKRMETMWKDIFNPETYSGYLKRIANSETEEQLSEDDFYEQQYELLEYEYC
jgi:hypothetical protein